MAEAGAVVVSIDPMAVEGESVPFVPMASRQVSGCSGAWKVE